MEAKYYATCLWPGLAELWWRGRLSALPAAIAFSLALNLLIVARYIYPEWMAGALVTMACWIGVISWVFYVVRSVREVPSLIAPRMISEKPDRFPEAQAAYLSGNWSEAESLLTDVLAIEPRDPPALLLLAGSYRHSGRHEAAHILLEEISKLEIAEAWWLEWEAEAHRLNRAVELAKERQETEDRGAQESSPSAADLTASNRLAA